VNRVTRTLPFVKSICHPLDFSGASELAFANALGSRFRSQPYITLKSNRRFSSGRAILPIGKSIICERWT
jgi:hypothetical protein